MNNDLNEYRHVYVLARTYYDHGSAEVLGAFSSKELATKAMLAIPNPHPKEYSYIIQVCFLDGRLGTEFNADEILEGALAERNRVTEKSSGT